MAWVPPEFPSTRRLRVNGLIIGLGTSMTVWALCSLFSHRLPTIIMALLVCGVGLTCMALIERYVIRPAKQAAATNTAERQTVADSLAEIEQRLSECPLPPTGPHPLVDTLQQQRSKLDTALNQANHQLIQEKALLSRVNDGFDEVQVQIGGLNDQFRQTSSAIQKADKGLLDVSGKADAIGQTLEQAGRDLETIDTSLHEIQQGAQTNVAAVRHVQQDAEQGLRQMKAVQNEMMRIDDESRRATTAIDRLAEQTREIGTITEVIRELVADTELLAFNAAIIAAKAGEEGQAFGVIAEEVKELADRTTSSARDIHQILRGIRQDTDEVREAVGATSQRILQGITASNATEEGLQLILTAAEKATLTSAEIQQLTGQQGDRARTLLREASLGLKMLRAISTNLHQQKKRVHGAQNALSDLDGTVKQLQHHVAQHSEMGQSLQNGVDQQQQQLAHARNLLLGEVAAQTQAALKTLDDSTLSEVLEAAQQQLQQVRLGLEQPTDG